MNESIVTDLGSIELPAFSGIRWMMMPFVLHAPLATIPNPWWAAVVEDLVSRTKVRAGVAYLTIDESIVAAGETHRRPGLHVDGVGPDGKAGGWGGGGWGASGMITASSHTGCRAWTGKYDSSPKENGDCEHLREQLEKMTEIVLSPNRAYILGGMTLHESLVHEVEARRQFLRISFPSTAPWYKGYTRSPYNILPTGPIHEPRTDFMNYRR